MVAHGSQAALICWEDFDLRHSSLRLLNLSYGGMAFYSAEGIALGSVHDYLLNIKSVGIDRVVFVKARLEWAKPLDVGGFLCGASLQESSIGWLRQAPVRSHP
jgi:hypothetical protein